MAMVYSKSDPIVSIKETEKLFRREQSRKFGNIGSGGAAEAPYGRRR